jgi:voltage-gated potassium channel
VNERGASLGRWTRLFAAVGLLAVAILAGAFILWGLGGGKWSMSDALYFAVNAVSTVGFRELEGLDHVRFARVAVVGLILAGLGTVAYFQSSLTAVLVQGALGDKIRLRRMQNRIDSLSGHVIVTGAGATGMHVVEELQNARSKYVVIDRNRNVLEHVSRLYANGDMLHVVGDATEDEILVRAGVARATAVIAALTEDKDNLFVTLTARSMNAKARIVSKVIGPDAAAKMVRAGADATVSPNMMGGRRLAGEVVRPTVIEFWEQLRKDDQLELEEVPLPKGSGFVGKTLKEVPIRAETKLLVVALRVTRGFVYNPDPSTRLEAGTTLVVLGPTANINRLRELVAEV